MDSPRGSTSEFSEISNFSGAEELNAVEPPRPLMRELSPATDYPLNALGPVMKAATEAIHDKTQAALALCAQSVMATAALATQIHYDIELPTGQRRPTSIFAVSVAQSGDRKSSADDLAIGPILTRERELRDQHKVDLVAFTNQKQAWDETKAKATKNAKGDIEGFRKSLDELGPSPEPPLDPLLIVPEPTFEGLLKLLSSGQPGVGLFSGEGGQFIAGHAMNKDNRLKTAAGLSTLWDNGSSKRVRSGDGVMTLTGRRVSMHLLVQPGVASEMLSDPVLADQGLLSRILVAAPLSPAGSRRWHEADPASDRAIATFGKRILSMLEKPMPLFDGKANELNPVSLKLSPRAREMWISFADYIEERIRPDGPLRSVMGLANKAPEHAARVAAIFAAVEGRITGENEVGQNEMASGIQIAQYHLDEALRLYDAGRVDPNLLEAGKLLEWLHKVWDGGGSVSLPDIYQLGPNSVRSKSDAEKGVGILIDHGWLIDAGPGEINGVPRRETYRIVRA